MLKKILFLLIILFVGVIVFAQNAKDISRIFSKSQDTDLRSLDVADGAVTLNLNMALVDQVYMENNEKINLTIPISENEDVTLDLVKMKVLNDNFILRTSSGDTLKDYKHGLFYRGTIRGKEGFVTMSVFDNEIIAIFSIIGSGNYNIGRIKGSQNQYIVYNDFKIKTPRYFECHTPDTPLEEDQREHNNTIHKRTGECVKFYLEGDYELYQDKGGVAPASNYITALFAEVTELYANEEISIEISEIMVWDTPDNYTNDDAGTDLDIFQNNNPTFNGDLASLLSIGGGDNGLGGLAYVDVLCSSNWAYSYCSISGNYNNVPSYSWDVEVCAHEWGHNFGSRHTHACVWNGNGTQIDDCGNQYSYNNGETPEGNQCFDPNNPILPNHGTIMSYCHLIAGIGINFGLGFGPLPGNKIRSEFNNAGCLTACSGGLGDPPVANFEGDPLVICEGEMVNFTDLSTNDPTAWNWTFLGGDPTESSVQNPSVSYYVDGTYDVTLEVTNSAGSDNLTFYDYVTVNKLAVPSFTYTIVNGNEVHFTNLSEFANDYYWEFGDGESSSVTNPVHVYDIDGIYTVNLFAANNNCTVYQEFVDYIEIITPPVAGFNFTQTDFCKPSTIQFFDASSSNINSRQWVFEGGYPATSTALNPVVQYNVIGEFNVKLTVFNELYSDVKELFDTVKIDSTPIADFTYTINGNLVVFTNTSENASSYLWNFGDNTTSAEANPTHTYLSGGTFTVTLTASNHCGPGVKTRSFIISAEPNAEFSVDETSGCAPFSTTFHNLSNTDNVLWVFEGANPSTSTQLNPVVNYMNAGQYKVTLFATNALGTDTLIRDDYIEVFVLPSGAFTSSVSGYTANFTQSTNNVSGFYWKFGDGAESTQVNPSHIYQEDGTYLVEFIYFNNCDTLTYSTEVIIANPPLANFSYSANNGCQPLTVNFTNTSSSNATNYLWSFEGGTPATSTLENPVVTFHNKGLFNVNLTASNNLGSSSKFEYELINVFGTPIPDFTHTNVELNYIFNYTGESASQIKWLFGDGTSAFGQQVNHTYSTVGTYQLKLIATNTCGSDTLEYPLVVSLVPTAGFIYNVQEGCAPLEVQFQNTSTTATSVFWIFEGGIPSFSTGNNPIVTYPLGGYFDVKLIAYGATGSDTLFMENIISVDAGPEVNFNYTINGAEVAFNNDCSPDAEEFFWDFGDGTVSEEENPIHTYMANGTYTVSLFATNECGQQYKTKNVLMTTVKTHELFLNQVMLYPNPNNGVFSLEFETIDEGNYNFRVYNSTGQLIFNDNRLLKSGSNKLDFVLSDLPQGLYLLKIVNDTKSYNASFSKQ